MYVFAWVWIQSYYPCFNYFLVLKCQCLRTSKTVQPSLIKKVQEIPPRPYCSKLEIIVTLKNNVKVCLDPTHKFAKAIFFYCFFNKVLNTHNTNTASVQMRNTA
uniref:Chemokine interleukin-8-like domain-containing protein n=1 Tax=Oryzias latipes TaxID=8090 RepID=A0A3B3HJI2_ORYLA